MSAYVVAEGNMLDKERNEAEALRQATARTQMIVAEGE